MKKLTNLALIALVALMALSSCATSIAVVLTKPSDIDMGSMQKIAVLPVGFAGETGDPIKAAFGRYSSAYYYRSEQERMVAADIGNGISEALMRSGNFTIVSSSEVGRLVLSGQNPAAATDGYILAEVSWLNIEYKDRYENIKGSDGIIRSTLVYDKTATLRYTVRVYRAVDGVLLGQTMQEQSTMSTSTTGYGNLRSDYDMLKELINGTMPAVVKAITPYKVTEYRVLAKDETKSPEMERADELVKKGAYGEALAVYRAEYAKTKNFAAAYNAAILVEIMGDLKGAIVEMENLYKASGNAAAATELQRMQKTLADAERLKAGK